MYGGGPTRQEDMYPPGGGHPPGMGDVYSTANSGTPFGYPAQQPPYPPYGPPSGGGYPPPPQQGGYGYGGGYPPQQGGYPPPQGGYDGYPPPGGYPPNQGYPPGGGGYYGQPPPQGIPMQETGPYRTGRSQSDPECNNGDYAGFSDPEVRKGFIKKVYAILSVQLAVTAAIVFPFSTSDKIQEFADSHHYLIYVAMILYMAVMIPLVCCEGVRRSFPLNFILLGVMTIAMGVLAGFISSRYQTKIVLITLGMTALVCLTVTFIACFAPVDITGCGLLMCILGIAFTIFGIISTILVAVFHLKIMILVYSGIAVALFSLYLMFDTQQIMGGKRVELSPEEYILGALQLYIDIIQIFLNLLPLVAACFGSDD